jgi:lysozyme family protein
VPNDYNEALKTTVENEGTKVDAGGVGGRGSSLYGITQKSWDAFTKENKLTNSKVETITPAHANLFYKKYFNGTGIENLPPEIYKQVFDYGVQSGPKTAVMKLQKLLEVKADGQIGPKTLNAINEYSESTSELALDYLSERKAFLENLAIKFPKTHGKNYDGYMNRIAKMQSLVP